MWHMLLGGTAGNGPHRNDHSLHAGIKSKYMHYYSSYKQGDSSNTRWSVTTWMNNSRGHWPQLSRWQLKKAWLGLLQMLVWSFIHTTSYCMVILSSLLHLVCWCSAFHSPHINRWGGQVWTWVPSYSHIDKESPWHFQPVYRQLMKMSPEKKTEIKPSPIGYSEVLSYSYRRHTSPHTPDQN